MPTLEQWTNALLTDQQVHVDSNAALCAQVVARQDARRAALAKKGKTALAKAKLTPVPGLLVKSVTLKPIELLHAIGRITTPPVENLADISATYAILRYLWAFAIPPAGGLSNLRLSVDARRIDFHQKALLSDEVGVGLAYWLMENELDAGECVDVSAAQDDVATWGVIESSGPSPDYLFTNEDRTRVYVVECKGTQTSKTQSLNQLRRGTEQVIALDFSATTLPAPLSFIFATCMQKRRTTIFAIDPPPRKRQASAPRPLWRVRDEKAFRSTLERVARTKLLHYAGLHAEARELGQLRDVIRKPSPKISRDSRETEYGVFRGIRSEVEVGDGVQIRVFRGFHEGRLKHMTSAHVPTEPPEIKGKKPSETKRSQIPVNFSLEGPTKFQNESKGKNARLKVLRDRDRTLAQSFSKVGTLFEIELRAQ